MSELRLRREKLEWVQTGDEIIALDEFDLTYISANGSGTLLWQELARGTTRARLIARLVDAFGVEPDIAARDVDIFLGDIERRGLLEP